MRMLFGRTRRQSWSGLRRSVFLHFGPGEGAVVRGIGFPFVIAVVASLSMFCVLAQNQAVQRSGSNQQQRLLVLQGGLLIDGTGRAPLKNPVVILSGGKIQSIAAMGSIAIPPGATVI